VISVLTIGNSFADNATRYLEDFVASAQVGLIVGKANLGGCSLEKHWNLVEQCDLLPFVRPYELRMTGRQPQPVTLREALTAHPWDYVTLQQVSDLSWRPETYFPYIEYLYNLVRELAPQAQPVIHQTWAYRCDAPLLAEWGIDQEQMFAGLKRAYNEAAAALSCPLLPCGEAFQKARAMFGFVPDPSFDYENPKLLALPEQSRALIVGYYWQTGNTATGKAQLRMDERHANHKGCYLAAAVWYEMLTGKAVADNPFCPGGLTAAEKSLLQQAAHAAVLEYGGPLR
jgi:hypothetical protein